MFKVGSFWQVFAARFGFALWMSWRGAAVRDGGAAGKGKAVQVLCVRMLARGGRDVGGRR